MPGSDATRVITFLVEEVKISLQTSLLQGKIVYLIHDNDTSFKNLVLSF